MKETQKLDKMNVQILNENDEEHSRGKLSTELSVGAHKLAVENDNANASLLNASHTEEQKQAGMGNESKRNREKEKVNENEEDNESPSFVPRLESKFEHTKMIHCLSTSLSQNC